MGGYQIIKFCEEGSVEVVPSSWIVEEEGGIMCLWPNIVSVEQISNAIKKQQIPKDNWKKFTIEVLSKHAYSSFLTASSMATKATYTSCLESENDDTEEKRRKKRTKRFISSDEESPLRRSPRYKDMSHTPDPYVAYPTPPKHVSAENLARVNMQTTVIRNLEKNLSTGYSSNKGSTSILTQQQSTTNQISHKADQPNICSHTAEFQQVVRILHIINTRSIEQSKLLDSLIARNLDKSPTNRDEEEIDFSALPRKSSEGLIEFDTLLRDNRNLRDALLKKLCQVGGDNLKDLIKRLFARLVEDNVLREYSWIGGKGKKKFALLMLAEVIKDVCKSASETKLESEKKVEATVSVFLAKSSERCLRTLGRDTKVNEQNTE